jgi:DNA polymerase III delta subunit
MVGFTREETVWQIQDLMLRADLETVLAKINDLLTVSKVPPILARFAMIDLARKLHGVSAGFAAGTPQASLDANLKLWGGMKPTVVNAARRADRGRLADLLRESVEADLAAKSGGTTDEVRSIERLAVRFASVLH